MGLVPYRPFRNCVFDLQKCEQSLKLLLNEHEKGLSESELEAAGELIKICGRIVAMAADQGRRSTAAQIIEGEANEWIDGMLQKLNAEVVRKYDQ